MVPSATVDRSEFARVGNRHNPPLSASTRMYRVLGGTRPTPSAGTRDDGARGTGACRTPG
ncbi:hypothetical protein G155_00099 [Mycobacterium sp. VKM Ac-1817D]|nr:hypothetical protein G155_00099 [Mycobacterium sp. VKM Ac-1817D]